MKQALTASTSISNRILAENGKPEEIMDVIGDGIDASRRLFFCLYDHEDVSDTLHCFDHFFTNTKGDFRPKRNFASMLKAKGLDKQIETMMIKPPLQSHLK